MELLSTIDKQQDRTIGKTKCTHCCRWFRNRGGMQLHFESHPECRPSNLATATSNQDANVLPASQDVSSGLPHEEMPDSWQDEFFSPNDASFPVGTPAGSSNQWEAILRGPSDFNGNAPYPPSTDGLGDSRLIDQHQAFLARNNRGAFFMTDAHKVQTSLRAILHKFNAPLYAFDEIQKWAHDSARLVKYNFADQKLPSLQSYTQSVFQRFDLHGIKPKLISLTLPVEHCKVDIVIHDVRQMVYSMLNNPSLMEDDNILFTADDPFAPPPVSCPVLGDINTGSRYREAYDSLDIRPGVDVPCTLLFFIDKTHTNTYSNLCLDPVTFTLGIFKRNLRNQPRAWRTLGYIPNQAQHGTKALNKAIDFQAMVGVIIKDVDGLNDNGGIRWNFNYKGKEYNVVFKFTDLFITGIPKVATRLPPTTSPELMLFVLVGYAMFLLKVLGTLMKIVGR